jgi:hypothetical protein
MKIASQAFILITKPEKDPGNNDHGGNKQESVHVLRIAQMPTASREASSSTVFLPFHVPD